MHALAKIRFCMLENRTIPSAGGLWKKVTSLCETFLTNWQGMGSSIKRRCILLRTFFCECGSAMISVCLRTLVQSRAKRRKSSGRVCAHLREDVTPCMQPHAHIFSHSRFQSTMYKVLCFRAGRKSCGTLDFANTRPERLRSRLSPEYFLVNESMWGRVLAGTKMWGGLINVVQNQNKKQKVYGNLEFNMHSHAWCTKGSDFLGRRYVGRPRTTGRSSCILSHQQYPPKHIMRRRRAVRHKIMHYWRSVGEHTTQINHQREHTTRMT